MNCHTAASSLLVTVTMAFNIATLATAQVAPDPSPWSFLQGTWDCANADGTKTVFTCKLNNEKSSYILSSAGYQGTLGIDTSSDHPMLAVGYHPGKGYSVGHWKQESPKVVSGGFWMVDEEGVKTEYKSTWEITDDGVVYSINGDEYSRWRQKK